MEILELTNSAGQQQEPKKETQARDWVFVVNNPKLTEAEMSDYLKTLVNVRYFIFSREKGDGSKENQGTEHHQGYIEFSAPKRFSTMKSYFSAETIGVNGHIKPRYAKRIDNVNYVKKTGKHKDKAHTRLSDIYEYGEFSEYGGQRNDLVDIMQMIQSGASDEEIKDSYPSQFFLYQRNIENLREMALNMKYSEFLNKYREGVQVYYVYGKTRTGKSRYVYEKHGFANVYKNQGYQDGKWFDGYRGQDVLMLDEYRSSFDFGMLLQYTDGQPVGIQCRFKNKAACYMTVYIVSNIALSEQHKHIQQTDPKSWDAFLQRLTGILCFDGNGVREETVPNRKRTIKQFPTIDDGELPF